MSIKDFAKMKISIASPDRIQEWSHGEVKKPETINYRTLNPEMDGLFCEKIFGPVKDWECACGKYKRMRYKGLVCEKCGVEVTRSRVRRERMGHIELAVPVAHIWYSKGSPNKMSMILGLSPKDLELILYFARYVVVEAGDTNLKEGQVLTEREYKLYTSQYGSRFEALMGAEAILKLLGKIKLFEEEEKLKVELEDSESIQKRKRIIKRLKIIRDFGNSGNRPEWMILKNLPVIPADLRPMVQLDGGRFATSDLNDLYRRVINRNNRLKKLQEIKAPEIVMRNEKRMLQEAVDALIDNGRRGKPVVTQNNRELKSLSDMLKGKQGRFRQNLLGKRVDYSGRSVIVVGPTLKLNQCGLPKKMALELYKPFIMRELVKKGIAANIKSAKRMVENEHDSVWEIIEEVIKDHPVLLNRAPTLHRLSIQAFEPVLIEGKAIRLHPLVCTAFNADFDGDQMAVHLLLSPEAIMEAKLIMLAPNNLIAPSNGQPVAVPSQDMVMGCFYMTQSRKGALGEGKTFANEEQALIAHEHKKVDVHTIINVRINGKIVETTPGRIMFNQILPEKIRNYNMTFGKGELRKLISLIYKNYGFTVTAELIDEIKNFGYHFATIAGVSVGIEDLKIPPEKKEIIARAETDIAAIEEEYKAGVIINEERYRKVVDVWNEAVEEVTDRMMENLDDFNPVYMMATSGARGNVRQMRQLGGMRGLMSDTQGRIIEIPIKANFREGLNVLEFFMSSHGARKGLADTALRTADSGYLTRRLVDIAHDVIVNKEDCGLTEGIAVADLVVNGEVIEKVKERITGRYLVDDLYHEGKLIVSKEDMITEEMADEFVELGITHLRMRSPLTCKLEKGVCIKCYGMDLSNHKEVLLGEAVGVIAAQSIGEPGTQLTMRTFHTGGVAEKNAVRNTIPSDVDGEVSFKDVRVIHKEDTNEEIVVSQNAKIRIGKYEYEIPSGSVLKVVDGQKVKKDQVLVEFNPYNTPIIAETDGIIEFRELYVKENFDKKYNVTERMAVKPMEHGDVSPRIVIFSNNTAEREKLAEYNIPYGAFLMVKEGTNIRRGEIMAKILKEAEGTKDITGGLPRVQELFEARNPKGKAIVSEIDGRVEIPEKKKKGMRVIVVKSEDEEGVMEEYLIPFGEHLVVTDGMLIKAGDRLTDGIVSPHDILAIKGLVEAEQYILESVQQVYREQGVGINDKHIEIIVKQMFKKVRVKDGGGSLYLEDEVIEKKKIDEENERLIADGKPIITFDYIIQGITKAAIDTESFISAASFQETTKVLSNAAIKSREDNLVGLKENVIIGKKIPAGTGFVAYKNKKPVHNLERIEE